MFPVREIFLSDTSSISVGTALGEGDDRPDNLESHRADFDQQNVIPENVFVDTKQEVHDIGIHYITV